MNHAEYLATGEYRERLQKMLEFARARYAATDYETFAAPMQAKIASLDAALGAHHKSPCSGLSRWLGMQQFVVTKQTPRSTSTIHFNSPPALSAPREEPSSSGSSLLRPIFTRDSIE